MTDLFSSEVLSKGQTYYVQRATRMRSLGSGVFTVRGTANEPYVVRTDADRAARTMSWATCTCAHGRNAGGGLARCSHVVAVLLAVREGAPLVVDTSLRD